MIEGKVVDFIYKYFSNTFDKVVCGRFIRKLRWHEIQGEQAS